MSAADPKTPEWLVVGERVAIVSGYSMDAITFDRVARFTQTRVVMESGEWYPLNTLSKRLGTWSGTRQVRNPKDPGVARSIRLQSVKSLAYDIDKMARGLSSSATDEQFAKLGRLAERLAKKCGVA